MALSADRSHSIEEAHVSRLALALRRHGWALTSLAMVFAFLVAIGALVLSYAVLAFGAAAAAIVFFSPRPGAPAHEAVAESMPVSDAGDMQTLIDALPDPVIALDREARVVGFNVAARNIAPALTRNQSISLALRVPALAAAIRHAIEDGRTQQIEFTERAPVQRWYAAHVIPASRREPRQFELLITLHDLTPLRKVEEMRADFVANASHELRTPLAALAGFIDTLRGCARDDPDARERFLSIMQAQASRMARLIDDLLSLSHIELSAHIRPENPVDLGSVVRQVLDALQTLAREREVEIDIIAGSAPLSVRGDRDELIRLFENLIENALKYAAAGKRVEIQLQRTAAEAPGAPLARISVRDYGPGIASEHLPRLTERFYRVNVGQSRAEGGTGLGLALVKHILNRHGGSLRIESALGAGSTFTVEMPLADPAI